jgi:hypothetical protein
MRTAFKEWSIIVDALGRGEQIVIFRKGGIHDGRDGFKIEQKRFLLFPTHFHQQRESVLPAAQRRLQNLDEPLADETVRIEFCAEVLEWTRLQSLAAAERFRGQHIWRDEVVAARFDWGRERAIYAMAVRIFRLRQPAGLPLVPAYGGCKSWIDLTEDLSLDGAEPVLAESEFLPKLERFRAAARTGPAEIVR